jgi:hypothetical protein
LKRVERRRGVVPDASQVKIQRRCTYCDHSQNKVNPKLPCEPKQKWPKYVKLLFDRKAPEMEKRLCFGGVVKISCFTKKHKIGDKSRTGSNVFSQLFVLLWRNGKPADYKAYKKDGQKGRENSSDSVGVKVGKPETSARKILEDYSGNQVSGNHEEDIHANEATREQRRKGVEGNHWQHSYGS